METLTAIVKKHEGKGVSEGTIKEHIQEARRVITERTRPKRFYTFDELINLVMEDDRFKTKYPDGNGLNNYMAVELAIGSSRLFIPTINLYGGKPAYERIKKKKDHT